MFFLDFVLHEYVYHESTSDNLFFCFSGSGSYLAITFEAYFGIRLDADCLVVNYGYDVSVTVDE